MFLNHKLTQLPSSFRLLTHGLNMGGMKGHYMWGLGWEQFCPNVWDEKGICTPVHISYPSVIPYSIVELLCMIITTHGYHTGQIWWLCRSLSWISQAVWQFIRPSARGIQGGYKVHLCTITSDGEILGFSIVEQWHPGKVFLHLFCWVYSQGVWVSNRRPGHFGTTIGVMPGHWFSHRLYYKNSTPWLPRAVGMTLHFWLCAVKDSAQTSK